MDIPEPVDAAPWQANGRDRTLTLVEPTRIPRDLLPDWHELLAAFCGHLGDGPHDHPVTRRARTLAELHLSRHEHPYLADEIDSCRIELVAHIDEWVVTHTHWRRSSARLESPGAVVDGMAAAQVRALHLLRTVEQVSDERVHAAWFLLASIADGWTDLVASVSGVRIRRSAWARWHLR